MSLRKSLLTGFLLLVFASLFRPAEAQNSSIFEDVSAETQILPNRLGEERAVGQAWGDFDNDGWVDLYVTDTAGPNTLFRNVRGERFERVDDRAVELVEAYSGGAVFADFDNDGRRDLYVLNWGENTLLRNTENGFVDVTVEAGVGGGDKNSQTGSWADYDQDGLLDLYVANWSCFDRCGRPQKGEGDRLYRNNGDGTFADVTRQLGGGTDGAGFVANFVDYDNDGDLDIYLVNDEFINPIGNKLWRNDGEGCNGWCWEEISKETNSNSTLMGMGLATTDYNRDGYFDFFFSNAGPMELLRNMGDGTFENVAPAAGVEFAEGIGWGTVFFDVNNDGWQDLYVAIMDGTDGGNPGNPLFLNNQDGTFSRLANSGARNFGRTLGAATADYNRDGNVDLIIGNIDEGYFLYENNGLYSNNHWITFDLEGSGAVNRDAVGSRVSVRTADGAVQIQEVIAGSSLGAGNELALHFGLGEFDSAEVQIRWPDGTMQEFDHLKANNRYHFTYGDSNDLLINSTRYGSIAGIVLGLLTTGTVALLYQRLN